MVQLHASHVEMKLSLTQPHKFAKIDAILRQWSLTGLSINVHNALIQPFPI